MVDGILTLDQWQAAGGRLNINSMRPHIGVHANALLRRHDWEDIDRSVVDVARTQLNVVSDLTAAGLVRPLGGLGSTVAVYEKLNDMSAADVHMDVPTSIDEDRVAFTPQYVPVPIHSKPFRVSARQLDASRRMGDGLDTTQTQVATRKVADSMEGMTVNGDTSVAINYESSVRTIYGFTTEPNRNSDTASNFGGGDFDTEGNGYDTINGMINTLKADGFYGPYGCYVSRTQHGQLMKRHTDGSGLSEVRAIRENLEDLQYIKASDELADGNLIVFQLSKDVVELAIAQDITTVQWNSMGGLVEYFIVMAAFVPLIKSAADGKSGVAHATGA